MSDLKQTCPNCGASLTDSTLLNCPYCNSPLQDIGRIHTDREIARVSAVMKETAAVPKRAARIVVITLFILFLLTIAALILHIPDKLETAVTDYKIDHNTSAMEKAYKNEDWDKLFTLIIDNSTDSLNSPSYFMYRTALFLHDYPPAFDAACDANQTEDMLFYYEIIASDYDMRLDDSFYRLYETDDAIEKALKEEYERETAIMKERGLENEMYKLRL